MSKLEKKSMSLSSIPLAVRKSRDARPASSTTRVSGSKRERSLDTQNRLTVGHAHAALKRSKSQLNIRTPLHGGARPSRASSTSRTPLSIGGRSPVLSSKKEKRPINDKKWQSEHLHKVTTFLLTCPDVDPNIISQLKPPSIKLFVNVMDLLFKQLDSRITITMENYKETVIAQLKIFKYPDNVTMSLMKTVNTAHSWPQVLAIFSWLIDAIIIIRDYQYEPVGVNIKDVEMLKLMRAHLFENYRNFNNNISIDDIDEKLKLDLAELYNLDAFAGLKEKNKNLKKEKIVLEQKKAKQEEYIKDLSTKKETLKLLIANAQTDKTLFKEDFEKLKESYNAEKTKLEELSRKKERLEKVVTKQEHSAQEVESLKIQIKDLQYTISLRNKDSVFLQSLADSLDLKISGKKRNIETRISELNREILELSLHDPELKSLLIRECGILRPDFPELLDQVELKKDKFIRKYEEDLRNLKEKRTQLSIIKKNSADKVAKKMEEIELLKNKVADKKHEIKEYTDTMNFGIEKTREEMNNVKSQIEEVKKNTPDLRPLQEEAEMWTKKRDTSLKEKEEKEVKAIKFFENLSEQILEEKRQLEAINQNIRKHVCGALKEVLAIYKDINENI